MVVDLEPTAITDYNRDLAKLQVFFLFCIVVAGKNSDWAASCISRLLRRCPDHRNPLDWLNDHQGTALHNTLVANKVGQYGRICECVRQAACIDLRTCSLKEMEGIFGVGPKTARFFMLHTRPDARCVPLDTHILKWLRALGVENVPQNTPTYRKEYERLESLAIRLMESYFAGLPLAQVDLLIWAKMSGRLTDLGEFAGFVDDPIV